MDQECPVGTNRSPVVLEVDAAFREPVRSVNQQTGLERRVTFALGLRFVISHSARFAIEGNDIRLSPRAALSLGMAFEELAINAVKNGAISNEAGAISIDWTILASALLPFFVLRICRELRQNAPRRGRAALRPSARPCE